MQQTILEENKENQSDNRLAYHKKQVRGFEADSGPQTAIKQPIRHSYVSLSDSVDN
jgi:hypothetical protein